jgi:hypothetical protein
VPSYAGPNDGKDHPIDILPGARTVAYGSAEHELIATFKDASGNVVQRNRYRYSSDCSTETLKAFRMDTSGEEVPAGTEAFERQPPVVKPTKETEIIEIAPLRHPQWTPFRQPGTNKINPLMRKIASEEAKGPVTKKPNSPQRFPNPGHAARSPKNNPNGKAMMAQTSKTKTYATRAPPTTMFGGLTSTLTHRLKWIHSLMRSPRIAAVFRSRVYGILCGIVVLALLILTDQVSMQYGLRESQRILDDVLGAAIAGLLFYRYELNRGKHLNEKLKTIELMNHHVRNALQVIVDSAYLHGHDQQISQIRDSARRIEWALREILPGRVLDEYQDRSGPRSSKDSAA